MSFAIDLCDSIVTSHTKFYYKYVSVLLSPYVIYSFLTTLNKIFCLTVKIVCVTY